jgi:hypothetical protein
VTVAAMRCVLAVLLLLISPALGATGGPDVRSVVPFHDFEVTGQRLDPPPGAKIGVLKRAENDDHVTIVGIVGEIGINDGAHFLALIDGLLPGESDKPIKKAIVVLDSMGGEVTAGVRIGWDIRQHGFATFVPPDPVCRNSIHDFSMEGACK